MDLEKKYPWFKKIKISKDCFSKWETANTDESLVFWSLKSKWLPRKEYFDWAVEYYQIPFLEDMFFEQQIMTKKQWLKVKDIASWSSEFLPVALWDDVIFVGCVDPHFQKSNFNFKHRLVLSSSRTLQMTWNFTKTLSDVIREDTNAQINLAKKDHLKNQAAGQFFSKSPDKQDNHSDLSSSLPVVETKTMRATDESGKTSPNIIPFKPISISPQEPLSSVLKQKKEGIQVQQNQFSQETIPLSQTEKKLSPSLKKTVDENSNVIAGNFSSKEESEITKTKTVYIRGDYDQKYEGLWKKTRPFFVTSMVLKVTEDEIHPLVWHGRIRIKNMDEALGHLHGYSLFKVVSRGLPYHGFAVDNPDNKNFFHKIGWEKYPQHITAIPIRNEQQKLYQIFVGLGTQNFPKEKIKHIEKIIAHFFQSHDQTGSEAA